MQKCSLVSVWTLRAHQKPKSVTTFKEMYMLLIVWRWLYSGTSIQQRYSFISWRRGIMQFSYFVMINIAQLFWWQPWLHVKLAILLQLFHLQNMTTKLPGDYLWWSTNTCITLLTRWFEVSLNILDKYWF